ncbi:BgTH12-01796 [Blumeria graminis f. sp. triticale]|uniref:BgTH12-01796 n=1 Tax=Blumeria graminis f. sp. triticale TaxID=1689686 RepID=A0A9W4CZS5_BLUGR|nr:BgTH12-01796 [Blumeria graminis f. sp. triticale]
MELTTLLRMERSVQHQTELNRSQETLNIWFK